MPRWSPLILHKKFSLSRSSNFVSRDDYAPKKLDSSTLRRCRYKGAFAVVACSARVQSILQKYAVKPNSEKLSNGPRNFFGLEVPWVIANKAEEGDRAPTRLWDRRGRNTLKLVRKYYDDCQG